MRIASATPVLFAAVLLAGAALAPSAAHADPLNSPGSSAVAGPLMDLFTLTYDNQTLTYELPANPSPSAYGENYNFVLNTTASYGGGGTCSDSLEFYTATPGGGGFQDSCLVLGPNTDPGVQLFSGDVSDPTFLPGTYNFTQGTAGTLTISQIGATPEPSSLVLLGTGVLATAFAARRRLLGAPSR